LLYFGATAWQREKLPRIKQLARIPCFSHLLHHTQIDLVEDESHFFLLLYPDAVFPGNRTPRLRAYLEYLMSGFAHALDFAWNL
jgi:hypothetical protein